MKSWLQFGVVRLLVFTTLVALLLGWMVRIRWNYFAAISVGSYLLLMILWATFRGPWIWSELRRIQRERKERQLATMLDLERRRRESLESKGE